MEKLMDEIRTVCEGELLRANGNFRMFGSDHEGSSVIREEIEETEDALQGVKAFFDELWDSVKGDNGLEARVAAGGLKEEALHAAAEAVQVMAMAQKFIDSQDVR